MQVTATIFKAYDIRGTFPRSLDEALAEGLGRAFGTLAMKEGCHTVAVGCDGRLSGPVLSAALIRGLVSVQPHLDSSPIHPEIQAIPRKSA